MFEYVHQYTSIPRETIHDPLKYDVRRHYDCVDISTPDDHWAIASHPSNQGNTF